MDISFGAARAIDDGVWRGTLRAAEALRLPGAPLKITGPHVVLLQSPVWNGAELRAPFDGISVLALGSEETALFFRAAANADATARDGGAPASAGPAPSERIGDAAFVADLDYLGSDMVRVGTALLARIRAVYPGRLTPAGAARLYVETPDNFWSVEVQPRRGAIKLVVRTSEHALLRAGLPYESERPPSYWAMKVCGDGDIETALRFLAVATQVQKEA